MAIGSGSRESSLSDASRCIWAKLGEDGSSWLPLAVHLRDAAGVAGLLWDRWLPESTKGIVSRGLSGTAAEPREILIFLAASHDLGKATPAFQIKAKGKCPSIIDSLVSHGLRMRPMSSPDAVPHATASELIMERSGLDQSVADVCGAHHGTAPTKRELKNSRAYPANTGFSDPAWKSVQDELLWYAVSLSGTDMEELRRARLDIEAQAVLSGLVIMADWISSNEAWFPYDIGCDAGDEAFRARVGSAAEKLSLTDAWAGDVPAAEDIFRERFGFEARPFQAAVAEAACEMRSPGVMVIEAPMGEGKTEAALAAAEILAHRFGAGGIMFALPTQATSDGVFPRVEKWIGEVSGGSRHTVFLAHGKSRYNRFYMDLPRAGWNVSGGPVVVNEWFSGRKKGLLSDFAVGTVDQLLMGGLRQRHLALRHLGLANKVVIIDECHAYDAYMGSYLQKVMQWLGAYRVPVILLSATLPPSRRRELVDAYTGKKSPEDSGYAAVQSYPVITYSDGEEVKQRFPPASGRSTDVSVERIADEALPDRLGKLTSQGGYAGIIVNTVGKAQRIADELAHRFGKESVRLLHSRFTVIDRSVKESEAVEMLSKGNRKAPPFRMFIVGTQVMEQSLDLDFDVMATDLCPVDLLIQRIGRLHRHDNVRPGPLEEPRLLLLDKGEGEMDAGSRAVYGDLQLLNTRLLVKDRISVPADVEPLVRAAYSPAPVAGSEVLGEDYSDAEREAALKMKKKETKASAFQISGPTESQTLIGWTEFGTSDSEAAGRAAVRDTDGSVEVILVGRSGDGAYRVIPYEGGGGEEIPSDSAPAPETGYEMQGCKIALPRYFSRPERIEETLESLASYKSENIPSIWDESEWLAGENYLVLDDEGRCELCGKRMAYDSEIGLRFVDD
ncbi:MAG: CRISPR-associated helicase Cas3' [Methanomethylophilus sp.]|jgi:CRISPR-associated endonuclease/helicase Cas3